MNVALATCAPLAGGFADDQPLAAALRERGAAASFPVWDDPGVDWDGTDLST